jgi:AcrR family transcriptional regulator
MTRDEILNAAASIFSQVGYHAASMQDIADAVNLQKASLYHHFSSKQEILFNLLNKGLDILSERLDEVLAQQLTPDQKLRQAMASYLIAMAEFQNLSALLLLEYRSLDPDYRSDHVIQRDLYELKWRDIIQEGKEAHLFNCHDPSLTSRAILGVLNWAVTWYHKDGSMSPQKLPIILRHYS